MPDSFGILYRMDTDFIVTTEKDDKKYSKASKLTVQEQIYIPNLHSLETQKTLVLKWINSLARLQ